MVSDSFNLAVFGSFVFHGKVISVELSLVEFFEILVVVFDLCVFNTGFALASLVICSEVVPNRL